MEALPRSKSGLAAEIAFWGLLFLFFFQLLTDFIEAIYAFGLLGTSIPPELVSVVLLFSPLLLLILPGSFSARLMLLATGELMLVCRAAEVWLPTRGRMLVAGLGVACFLVFFPALINRLAKSGHGKTSFNVGAGLIVGMAFAILLRSLSSGMDSTTTVQSSLYGSLAFLGVSFVLTTAIWLPGFLKKLYTESQAIPLSTPSAYQRADQDEMISSPAVIGVCLGISSVWLVLYFAFTSPNVIARWAEASYMLVVGLIVIVLGIFTALLAFKPGLMLGLSKAALLAWNLGFTICLAAAIFGSQLQFTLEPASFPIYAPPVSLVYQAALIGALLLSPVILLDFILFIQELASKQPTTRAIGAGFSVGSLFMLIMIFAHVFTTVYDYIPVVGPFFRDKFWLVYLVIGLVVSLATLLVSSERKRYAGILQSPAHSDSRQPVEAPPFSRFLPMVVVLLGLFSFAAVAISAARPGPPPNLASLKILTYNIQQGYDAGGQQNTPGQLRLFKEENPDLIALQESDTNRIAGGNRDLLRYFANNLGMYSYYGPKTVTGTFGIALLSRYPIENPRTFYMYSKGEQTATIDAQIDVNGQKFHIYVTHLGNGGPIIQLEQMLQEIDPAENVVALGDFNFRPDSEQYRLITEKLDDAWLRVWPGGESDQEIDPLDRIDHIFISPGLQVEEARYLTTADSDHPAMYTILGQ